MKLFPAIDIKGGRCVRLFQGRMDQETVYSLSPRETAQRWEEAGAEYLHVVDLDGAVAGEPVQYDVIEKILRGVRVPVQVGGGIRKMEDIRLYLEGGARRVILGSAMIRNVDLAKEACRAFPGRIAAGIDASDGWVAVQGWKELTRVRPAELCAEIDGLGLGALIFTDIQRDGTLKGPNREALRELCRSVRTPVIASGGISSVQDLIDLFPLVPDGLEGVIIGKALYAGAIDLKEALARTASFRK
jgi:phosphoribosylformimino-5-aminoimidazole carboxamide ribotide isomerase